jgi:hypothetical protein
LRANAEGRGSLDSPDDLAFRPADYRAIIIKAATHEVLTTVEVEGQTVDGKWVALVPATDLTKLQRVNAGLLLPLTGEYGDKVFKRIRLNWKAAGSEPLVLEHIAFYVH